MSDTTDLFGARPMNHYERKQEARRERLEAAAERAQQRAAAAFKRADMSEAATGIPFGQPVLVGHHSERRHRAAIERADRAMHKFVDENKRARELAGKAAGVGTGGISSDDPDAIDKLREKLASLEADQTLMRECNKVVRAFHKAGIRADATPEEAARYLEKMQPAMGKAYSETSARKLLAPDFCGRIGFPDYALSNNSGNMARIKKRIEQLEAAATRENKEVSRPNGVRLVQNVDENRLQIIFPGKPSAEVRAKLKSHGFRWSPTAEAWQRQLSNSAIWAADQALKD